MKDSFASLLTEFKSVPWKNGKGLSQEIALEPAGCGPGDDSLLWRLSLARVDEPGEFSLYPGCDRFLTLVQGDSLLLEGGGKELRILPGDVHHFSGDQATKAELPSGPVKDLGLVYRRDKVKAEMATLDFTGRARSFRLEARLSFFYVISGTFTASAYPGERRFELEPGSVLRISSAGPAGEKLVLLEPKKPGGLVATVEIR